LPCLKALRFERGVWGGGGGAGGGGVDGRRAFSGRREWEPGDDFEGETRGSVGVDTETRVRSRGR
jgi:hypothetical protein